MKVFVKSLNPCAVRKIKVQQYQDFLIANGHELVSHPAECDVVLVWSCGYRDDYRMNSLLEANRYRDEYQKEVILAGCVPDIDPNYVREHFSGIIINWRDDTLKMEEFFAHPEQEMTEIPLRFGEQKLCENAQAYKRAHPDKDASFSDQFIKLYVSEGCNLECSFCAERLMFPPYKSFPQDALVATCRQIVEETGELEVMLHADSVGDYGSDIGSTLPNLLHRLKQIHPELKIGMQGFNPAHFIKYYDEMATFIRNGDIFHLRIPIQSASSRLLRRMNRTYTREDIDRIFTFFARTEFTGFSTDMIVGFPGETEDEYEETLQFLLRYRPMYVLLSAFMESPLLAASHLSDKVDLETTWRRLMNADTRLSDAGIICNTDGGALSAERRRRLNLVS